MIDREQFKFIDYPVIMKKRLHQNVFAYDSDRDYLVNSEDDMVGLIENEKNDGAIWDAFRKEGDKEKPYVVDIPEIVTSYVDRVDNLQYRFYKAKRNIALHVRARSSIKLSGIKFDEKKLKIHLVLKSKLNLTEAYEIVLFDALSERYILSEVASYQIFPFSEKQNDEYVCIINDDSNRLSPKKADRKYCMFLKFSSGEMVKIGFDKEAKFISEGSKKEAILDIPRRESPKVKIAIFGSCYSRRAFTSKSYYNPGYKEKYEVVLTQFQSSICTFRKSVPKSNIESDTIIEMNPNPQQWATVERTKNFIECLREVNPDYLIIDLHGDIQRGYIEYPNGERLTHAYFNNDFMKKHPNFKRYTPSKTFSSYFEEFKKSLKDFLEDILSVVPEEKIIINRTNASLNYYDKNHVLVPFEKRDTEIKTYNMIANTFFDYVIAQLPEASVIDSFSYETYADINAPGDHSINHFESKHYKQFMKDVDKVIILNKNE
ncbi:hypothetical protein E3422_002255 [Enterococcus faecium]|nr:hypothetical protein [Enterococcus faecium]